MLFFYILVTYIHRVFLNLSCTKQISVIFHILVIHVQCPEISAVRQQNAEQILRLFFSASFLWLLSRSCLELMYNLFCKVSNLIVSYSYFLKYT